LVVVARTVRSSTGSPGVAENSAMRKMIVLGMLLGCSFLAGWIARDPPDMVQSLGHLARRSVDRGTSQAVDGKAQKAPPGGSEAKTAVFLALEN